MLHASKHIYTHALIPKSDIFKIEIKTFTFVFLNSNINKCVANLYDVFTKYTNPAKLIAMTKCHQFSLLSHTANKIKAEHVL